MLGTRIMGREDILFLPWLHGNMGGTVGGGDVRMDQGIAEGILKEEKRRQRCKRLQMLKPRAKIKLLEEQ